MLNHPYRSLATLLLVSATPYAAWAGATFQEGALSGELTLEAGAAAIDTRGINFGRGRVDLRSGESAGDAASWQEAYLEPGITLSYSAGADLEVLAGASVIGTTTLGDGDAGGYTREGDGGVAVEKLYAGVGGETWTFTAGRQDYRAGTGFIVMSGNLDFFDDGAYWLGPRSAFRDSAILAWGTAGFSAEAFTLRTDDDLGDVRLNGANLDYSLGDRVTLGALAMTVDALDDDAARPRDGMHVYALRALDASLPGLPALTFSGEYAVQTGSGDGVDHDATAWYAQADYALDALPLTPVIGYRYAHFSGDDDPDDTTRGAWDPLSKGFVDWGTWLIGDVVGNYLLFNSNQNVQQFSLETHLSPTLTLGAIHYQFWLDSDRYQGRPVGDRRFADESVVYLDWTPTPGLYASLSYNWVDPKAAAREIFGDDERFSAAQFYVTYRY